MNETPAKKLNLTIDYRWISLALLIAIVVMLIIWKPWAGAGTSDRTIDVTGEATVSARPDEFVFNPAYEFTNADKNAALEQLSSKSDEIVGELKGLGVADSDIKTNSDSWSFPIRDRGEGSTTYTLRLTITTKDEDLTQKVQDYLVSTSPTGSVSPQANFSDQKRKELENKAREQATKDARKKAEQSAENLGFSLASVKSVKDGSGFGTFPVSRGAAEIALDSRAQSLGLQPGENDLTYSVTVTYYIK